MQEMTNVPVGQEQLMVQDQTALIKETRDAGANWFSGLRGYHW
jgi:hypothetical protein